MFAIVLAFSAVAGVVVGYLDRATTVLWLLIVALVAFIALIMGLTLFLRRRLRGRGSDAFARSPLWEVGYRERTAIVKAIRRDRPLPPEQQDLALRTARHIVRRGTWLFWAIGVIGVLEAVNAAFNPGIDRIAGLVAACAALYLAGLLGWVYRRAQIYQRHHT